MPNNRVFYASQGVSITPEGGSATTVQGAQSVGVTTSFNLEQAFQLGQLALYDNIVADPEVTVSISKALDGESLIWQLATGGGSLVANANDQADIIIAVGDDTAETLTNTVGVQCTGMYISSLTYTFPVDGPFTEEIDFVGNSKSLAGTVSAPATSGNIMLRRQHFLEGSSTLPAEVDGKNLSNVTISADLGRESMYKLGSFAPFHRFVNFPLEVTTTFEVIAQTIDGVSADAESVSCTGGSLPSEQPIVIALCDGGQTTASYTFDLGTKNVLQSVEYSGGDTSGGNVTITYTYSTYNELSITSP